MTEQSKSKRLFIAIFPDQKMQTRLQGVCHTLEKKYDDDNIRWASNEKYHLTLRFLGNTSSDNIETLVDHLQQTVTVLPRFSLCITGITGFPHPHNPHVIAAEFTANDALTVLAKAVEQTVVDLGYPTSKHPFRPHLTLGRIKQKPMPFEPVDFSQDPITFDVTECFLMSSVLDSQGAEYYPIEGFELAQ